MNPFPLPNYSNLSTLEYSFSRFQQNIINRILSKINEIFSHISSADGIEIRSVALYVTKYFVNLFTRNDSSVITIYCYTDDGYIYYKITENVNSLIESLCNFISINLSQYGIFTRYWDPLNMTLVLSSVDENDIVLCARSDENVMDDIIDRTFEANREEVIEKTFECTHEHNIIIGGTVDRNNYNSECHLCYEEAMYQCSKCEYPICDKCMKILKKSTGKCPCCQAYPLLLNAILLKDEVNEDGH